MAEKVNAKSEAPFSRQKLKELAATLSVFHWLEANDLMHGEVKKLYKSFLREYGAVAQEQLDLADPAPSWEQIAYLLKENKRLQELVDAANHKRNSTL